MAMGYPERPKKAKDHSLEEMVPAENQVGEPTVGALQKIEQKMGIPWKSIFAFFGVFLGQLWARAAVNGVPVIPENVNGWLALIGGSFVAAIGVYFKGNVYTVPQAEKKLQKAIKTSTS